VVAQRKDLHDLIDDLPANLLPKARSYLRFLREVETDPLRDALLSAPEDDEPLTADEEAMIREADEAIKRGEIVPWEQVKRELREDVG
jgi:hypothetical protein